MRIGICVVCGKEFFGRTDKITCSQFCRRKNWRDNNQEKRRILYKNWAEKNKVKKQNYMRSYRATDKYRLMKKRHDLNYITKNGSKKYVPREGIQIFRSNCRSYAASKIKKERCLICGTKNRLELHHSLGYKKQSIEGVIVVCKLCHLEVIHGRGTRVQNSCGQ